MYQDEIIREVWENRDAYTKRHNNDLHKMVQDLQRRQKKSSGRIVDRRTKTKPSGTAQ